MTIQDILKDAKYKTSLSLFTEEELEILEKAIYTRTTKTGERAYTKCLSRNKEIRLTPEEIVRQLFLYRLNQRYGYPYEKMAVEYPVTFGRQTKRADMVVFDKERPDVVYMVIELKKPKDNGGKEQLRSYCNGTGAPIGVWTNGEMIEYYNRIDPNYFNALTNIPTYHETLTDFLNQRFTIHDLLLIDRLQDKTLKQIIAEFEDEVLANAGVNVFEEAFKLIFIKLYDEYKSGKDKDKLELWFDINEGESLEDVPEKLTSKFRNLAFRNTGTPREVKERLEKLFVEAKSKWKGIFGDSETIELSYDHTATCVSYLQDVKLFNSNLEVIDDAFEYLVNKDNKGEKGQYFTPRYVIDLCVKMLNPKAYEFMIDTASGSCGFPLHTIFHVWQKQNPDENHLLTTDKKTDEQIEYVQKKVFAIDFDKRTVRIGRTLNLIAGDGETNVLLLNSLDYDRWNENRKNRNWMRTYGEGFEKLEVLRTDTTEDKGKRNYKDFQFDIVMANPPFAGKIKDRRIITKYELGKKYQYKKQKDGSTLKIDKGFVDNITRDILFIERNLDMLKDGGRMAVVLPQGIFNNSSQKFIREFVVERCRILAVVGLHGNTFKPHTGTKTSVLFVQKWDAILCPKKDDYNIFFATQQLTAKDNSGEKIYLQTESGERKKDSLGHFMVEHDLYNHNQFLNDDGELYLNGIGEPINSGETSDGIAEAFIEFSKKEQLSFF